MDLASDSSCMNKGECMKGFPKCYYESTYISLEGWPHLARQNNGRKANVVGRNIMLRNPCWKIFNYDLHYRSIFVEKFPFHEEECNRVFFRDNDDPGVIAERISSSRTKFTEWMVANQKYPEGRCLTYVDYPTMFTWHDDIKAWKPQKNGKCIGRTYYVTPAMGEKFYLRMPLNIVRANIGQFFMSSLPYLAPDVVHAQRCRLLNPHIAFTDEEI
nr:hypothetical protein [Tanacetum cinerariifolium]